MQLLSEHNRILRIGEGGTQEYFPGDNINITNHVISGKYWDNEINSAISSTSGDIVNEAFNQSTAWTEEQGYLTAHQDVSNLPYVQNSALGYNGNLISSISGDGFLAESANNSYHADDADHADSADNAIHADSADFVATANFANSASSALNAEVANVAYTALSAHFLDGGWEHNSEGFITAYNNSAFAGADVGGRYEGIEPIVVNNEEMKISAKSAKLGVQGPLYFVEDTLTSTVIGIDNSAFPTFEGTQDGKISAINGSAINAVSVIEYSGGNNIDITNHVISVTGIVDNAYHANSANYVQMAQSAHSAEIAISALNAPSSDSATYDNLGREITATYLTAHQDWTNTIQNASSNAYNSAVNWVINQHYLTGVTEYSAGSNISINDHVVSGKDWISEIQEASANAVTEVINTLTAVEFANSASALTTSAGWDVTEYSAGENVNITNHVISGKDWTSEIAAASAEVTAQIPDVTNLDYVQNSALNIDNGSITSISSYNVGHPQVSVSGESGIYLTRRDGTVYIGYSGGGGGSGQGVEYTGIDPIVVNNLEHKISAKSAVLGVQSPLYFVEDSESATVIGYSGGGGSDNDFHIYPGTTTNKEVAENSGKNMYLYHSGTNTYLKYAGKITYTNYAIFNFKTVSGTQANSNSMVNARVYIYPSSTSACSINMIQSVNLLNSESTVNYANTANVAYMDGNGNSLDNTYTAVTSLSSFVENNSGSWGGGGGGSTGLGKVTLLRDNYGTNTVYAADYVTARLFLQTGSQPNPIWIDGSEYYWMQSGYETYYTELFLDPDKKVGYFPDTGTEYQSRNYDVIVFNDSYSACFTNAGITVYNSAAYFGTDGSVGWDVCTQGASPQCSSIYGPVTSTFSSSDVYAWQFTTTAGYDPMNYWEATAGFVTAGAGGIPTIVVSTSAQATGSNILYIVTGA